MGVICTLAAEGGFFFLYLLIMSGIVSITRNKGGKK